MQSAQSQQVGECERVVVRKGDGRVFDLGKPKTFGFKWRLQMYRLRMWFESLRK